MPGPSLCSKRCAGKTIALTRAVFGGRAFAGDGERISRKPVVVGAFPSKGIPQSRGIAYVDRMMTTNFYDSCGVYGLSEAARLARLPAPTVRRWLAPKRAHAVWLTRNPVASNAEPVSLDFVDLQQLRVVAGLRAVGVSLQCVRRALDRAQDFLGLERPFASRRLKTDGVRVFLDAKDDQGRTIVTDLSDGQYVIDRAVAPTFFDVDFDASDIARMWWPLGRDRAAVLDPKRRYGAPIDPATRTPLDVLADDVAAGTAPEMTANAYEVRIEAVRAALDMRAQYSTTVH